MRNKERKQSMNQEAHKKLAATSNQRVIDKIHRMRMERLRARERRKQKAAEKKLSQLKAMKILQQKRYIFFLDSIFRH